MSSFNTFLSITKWAVPETRRLPDLCTVIALSRNNSLFSPIRQSSSTGPNPINNLKKSTLLSHHNRSLFPPLYSSRLSTSTNAHSKNMALSNEDAAKACVPPPAETEGFFFQQTMIRIKDPTRSLDFYSRVMGMTLLLKLDFPEMEFSLYFMGYEKPEDVPTDPKERAKFCFSRKATLELTHNHGTEKEENEVYHNGNSDPRGFGHIGIVVPDVYKASERFDQLGVPFVKKPDAGKMKGLAFIKDPDGYWIEILNPTNMAK